MVALWLQGVGENIRREKMKKSGKEMRRIEEE